MSRRKILKFPHCVFSIRLPWSVVYTSTDILVWVGNTVQKCTALLHSVKSGDFYTPRCDRYKNEETLNSSFFKNEESNNRWWEISLSHPQGLDLDYYSKSRFYRGAIIPILTTVAKTLNWVVSKFHPVKWTHF